MHWNNGRFHGVVTIQDTLNITDNRYNAITYKDDITKHGVEGVCTGTIFGNYDCTDSYLVGLGAIIASKNNKTDSQTSRYISLDKNNGIAITNLYAGTNADVNKNIYMRSNSGFIHLAGQSIIINDICKLRNDLITEANKIAITHDYTSTTFGDDSIITNINGSNVNIAGDTTVTGDYIYLNKSGTENSTYIKLGTDAIDGASDGIDISTNANENIRIQSGNNINLMTDGGLVNISNKAISSTDEHIAINLYKNSTTDAVVTTYGNYTSDATRLAGINTGLVSKNTATDENNIRNIILNQDNGISIINNAPSDDTTSNKNIYIASKAGIASISSGEYETTIDNGDGTTSIITNPKRRIRLGDGVAGTEKNGIGIVTYDDNEHITINSSKGTLILAGNSGVTISGGVTINGNATLNDSLIITSDIYGTDDPSTAITNPVAGQLYFKIIS